MNSNMVTKRLQSGTVKNRKHKTIIHLYKSKTEAGTETKTMIVNVSVIKLLCHFNKHSPFYGFMS